MSESMIRPRHNMQNVSQIDLAKNAPHAPPRIPRSVTPALLWGVYVMLQKFKMTSQAFLRIIKTRDLS